MTSTGFHNWPIVIPYTILMTYIFEIGIEHAEVTSQSRNLFMVAVSRFLPLRRTLLVVPRLPESVISCLRHIPTLFQRDT